MGCLWCGKHSRQCKTMPSGPPEFIPPFIPVTGMKCSYGKISSPLTEISGTEPARPLIWTHRKFYKGFRGEARSRKPGQPGQPGSYEEALNGINRKPSKGLKFIRQTSKKIVFYRQPWKMQISINRQKPLRYLKLYYFSWSSRTSGSWRISKLENLVLKNTLSRHYKTTCLYLKIFRNF